MVTPCANSNQIPCLNGHPKCYNISEICSYKLNKNCHLIPCRNGAHLDNCKGFNCNSNSNAQIIIVFHMNISVMAVGIVQQVLTRTFVGIYIGAFKCLSVRQLCLCAFILEIYVMISKIVHQVMMNFCVR